jgi:phosphoglycerol transferase MdoB-like AlkP superfamily enzyme
VYQVTKSQALGAARERDSTWRNPIKVAAAAVVAWILWLQIRLPKTPHTALLSLLAGYLAYFTFNAGVHENHLFIAMVLGLFLVTMPDELRMGWSRTREWWLGLGIVAFAHLNPLLFFGWRGGDRPPTLLGGPDGLDISVPLAALSLVLFVATVLCLRASGRGLASRASRALT